MKVIIASDIHGNLIYTQSLEELILKENPDKLILLGDYFSSYENKIKWIFSNIYKLPEQKDLLLRNYLKFFYYLNERNNQIKKIKKYYEKYQKKYKWIYDNDLNEKTFKFPL